MATSKTQTKKEKQCSKEGLFHKFVKLGLKTLILLALALSIMVLKHKYLKNDAILSNVGIFLIGATLALTIMGIVDNSLYKYLVVGLGVGLGMHIIS